MRKKTVAATTLGCKVNFYDTEAVMELFAESGYEIVDFASKADVYIINTCTVTNFGDKKSRQAIRRARKQNPEAIVAAIGCYSQVSPQDVANIEGVDIILGTKARAGIVNIVNSFRHGDPQICIVSDIMKERKFEKLSVQKLLDRQRAFLKIQEGCDRFCTYCIIPYARGPVRSREESEVLDEVKNLVENGYKEIVLTGIHVASYGKDLEYTNLLNLLKKVHDIKGLQRIRMSSVEPTVITEEFIEVLKELPKVCDHFHLSLQSGSDSVLKRMNRKYNTNEYKRAVEMLRNAFPNVAVTTDIIAGFPGETDEEFEESFNFIRDIKLSKLHVFPYSPKKGTPAALMNDQISSEIKTERTNRLLALNDELEAEFVKKVFKTDTFDVLFEIKNKNGKYEGLTTNYVNVTCDSEIDLVNNIVSVTPEQINNNFIYAKFTN